MTRHYEKDHPGGGMAGRRLSRQEVNRRRDRAGFVGRRGELAVFRDTFVRNPEDVDFPYLFHVHGNGGVGKSTLVRQWETTAREKAAAVTALLDDEVRDPLEAMQAVSVRLGRQGHPLKRFDKQMVAYRQRRHQAENAVPAAAAGPGEPALAEPTPASASSTVAAQVGLVGLGMLPGVGPFVGAVDPQQLALSADRLRGTLNMRLRSHDDVQLVLNPVESLMPVFLEDLAEVAQRCERVVLFFDVYERTGPVLDAWLQDIIFGEGHEGLPVNVQIVLSGRPRLDPRSWGDRLGEVTEVGLDVFTPEEARTLLATHGVTEESTVELILRLSGRLPLLVDMLARSNTSTRRTLEDPSETAVERFLKWEPHTHRREAALNCALPLQLNEDIYRAIAPEAATEDYPWLRGQAFISRQGGSCRYHDLVRTTMLRLKRTQSPTLWEQQHTHLAEASARWRSAIEPGLGTEAEEYWDDDAWREARLNETYHRLCAAPRVSLPDALLQSVHAADHDVTTLRRIAQILTQAGNDSGTSSLTAFGQNLEAVAEQDDKATIRALTLLLDASKLSTEARALAHTARGRDHRMAGAYDRALSDYAAALKISPESARVYSGLGETYRLMGRHDEAVNNYSRAIELSPDDSWPVGRRGEAYQRLGRYDDALTDLNHAIELNPQAAWAIFFRGQTYQLMGRYEEALTDLTHAIELDPQSAWALRSRGQTYQLMGRYHDALTDLNRAVDLAPK
ncbi:tetratricopeptide repeat protein [Streptomyces sp. NPDC021093]|uniref:tetratricopeptide repeat protein n=1 Tax=Streptomyces sp. NPDC021093 TaxID=3365112 RepID=UPI003796B95D